MPRCAAAGSELASGSLAQCQRAISGHTAIETYLREKIHKIDSSERWWFNGGERQSRHHLFVRCRAWAPPAERMWEKIDKEIPAGHFGQVAVGRDGSKGSARVPEG